jgi:hypothetical protein
MKAVHRLQAPERCFFYHPTTCYRLLLPASCQTWTITDGHITQALLLGCYKVQKL